MAKEVEYHVHVIGAVALMRYSFAHHHMWGNTTRNLRQQLMSTHAQHRVEVAVAGQDTCAWEEKTHLPMWPDDL